MGSVADRLTRRERTARQLEPDDGHESSQLKNGDRPGFAALDPAPGRTRHSRRPSRDGNAQAAIDAGTADFPSELRGDLTGPLGTDVQRAFLHGHPAQVAVADHPSRISTPVGTGGAPGSGPTAAGSPARDQSLYEPT